MGHDTSYGFFSNTSHTALDIVGMGISAGADMVYTWFDDWTFAIGTTDELSAGISGNTYTLPPTYTPWDIIGIGIAPNQRVYTWYRNGKASVGTSSDLDYYTAPYSVAFPPGKNVGMVRGIDIAYSSSRVYTWYSDGTVSVGTSSDLDYYVAPYAYTLEPGKVPSELVEVGIAPSDDHVYSWYTDHADTLSPNQISVHSGVSTFVANSAVRHPSRDAAIVKTASAFPVPSGWDGGYGWPHLYTPDTSTLAGRSLTCFGYGAFSCSPNCLSNYSGGGVLRRGDNVYVDGTGPWFLFIEPSAGDWELPWKGDSGGGCYIWSARTGTWGIVGVNSKVTVNADGHAISATQVAVPAMLDWISAND